MALKDDIEKQLKLPSQEISIIRIVDDIINYAYQLRTSDIHVDPEDKKVSVRFRIDGVMHEVFSIPKEIHPEIITRLKVLSDLRTDEHQAAQDGRISFKAKDGKGFDIRVSIVPTYYQENAVLRLLVEQGQDFGLKDVGFSKRDFLLVTKAIEKPYGMILSTGPTGSGKTTMLYTILKKLNTPDVSIITIEDPIEYSLEGIDQIQVTTKTGLTFAHGLRSILRQDPNIIMVGEIRDEETAKIAVNAALTGHLLLSTLHTNDAPTSLPRLIDMGVEPFLIISTVNIAIGQRLVRKICDTCKKENKYSKKEIDSIIDIFPPESRKEIKIESDKFYIGAGCAACNGSGYIGRVGIFEVMEVTEAIREAVVARKGAAELKTIAIGDGMTTMLQDGFKKATEGITTIEEILRVIHE